MRIAALLVSLVLFPASQLFADPLLDFEFLNSDFTFGTVVPDQLGRDLSSFTVGSQAPDWDFWSTGYDAHGSVLDHETFGSDAGGVFTNYFYTGGTFEILFSLQKNGQDVTGSFVAPIKTLTVTAGDEVDDGVLIGYALGPGLFDQSIASALGIGRHTSAGSAESLLLLQEGDHTAPERQAWDGVNDITLDVPEPATAALLTMGAGVWLRRRVRRT